MTLEDFITEERARLAAFAEFWRVGMRDKPEDFPDDLQAGDWDEQFFAFIPGEDTADD